jgi:4-hydroxythreonine-4-phosphate dehydrogenase
MSARSKPIALTIGDVAGIGPEIIARLYISHACEMRGTCVVGQAAHMRRAVHALGSDLPVREVAAWGEAMQISGDAIAVLPTGLPEFSVSLGRISAQAGQLAAQAIRQAARAALNQEVAAIVTAPIHKEALARAGESFPGHTELLQHEAAMHWGKTAAQLPVRMMLANPQLRVVLVSIHVGLRQALDAVTQEGVMETIRIVHEALSRTAAFRGAKPRIAVAGLNPHAGEGGLFGREEIEVIEPAVSAARALGMDVRGPFAPDTVFMRARQGEFDVVVAMYHDQGLIPVKYLGVEQGVNVTLGLPFVRTSPDHGTAFDIAGQGRADASSFLEALRLARTLASG